MEYRYHIRQFVWDKKQNKFFAEFISSNLSRNQSRFAKKTSKTKEYKNYKT